jgi:hypothetical protein
MDRTQVEGILPQQMAKLILGQQGRGWAHESFSGENVPISHSQPCSKVGKVGGQQAAAWQVIYACPENSPEGVYHGKGVKINAQV